MKNVAHGDSIVLRILIAVVWVPIQVTLSLLFATGGLFLVLILGIALSPFIGLFFLVRWGLRKEGEASVDEDAAPDPEGS